MRILEGKGALWRIEVQSAGNVWIMTPAQNIRGDRLSGGRTLHVRATPAQFAGFLLRVDAKDTETGIASRRYLTPAEIVQGLGEGYIKSVWVYSKTWEKVIDECGRFLSLTGDRE
jgi:hypothetical protein